jgi:hypothetical protein
MDARNFLFSSDYPMPVICWEWEANGDYWNVGANQTRTVNVAHKLPFKPLLIGQWALRADFAPSQDINTTTFYPVYDPINGEVVSVFMSSDGTNVIFDMQNFSATASKFYFRLWAYAPPDYTGEMPNVYDTTSFQLSTDYNYPKIVKQGTVSVNYKSEVTIPHGLGYIPQVRVWEEVNGKISPCTSFWEDGKKGGPRVTDQNLIIRNYVAGNNSGSTRKYYYHIYGDES